MDDGSESYARRFFSVVKRGQPDFIKDYLRHIDVNSVNEEGETALIIAAKQRNYIVQRLLIEKGANVNKTDKDGRTALHIESGYGDAASINLLLANKASINRRDSNGRTALHYAVRGSHYEVVDLLVFCGADGMIPDDNNVMAMDLCNSSDMRKMIKESVKTVHAIKLGYIKIERTVLRAGERRFFKELGCFVTIPENFSSSYVYTLSRRVRPEFGRTSLQLQSMELRISDTFEFRVEGGDIEARVIIDVPLYSHPEAHEEIHMKTNLNPVASDETVQADATCNPELEESIICAVQVDLTMIHSLMLVTRPKKERLPMSAKRGGTATSTIDTFVKFDVQPNTFSRDGDLVHYILPKPFEKESEDFLACSHFHDISYSNGEQPQRQVKMTIPLPPGYSTNKKYKMHVLVREGEDEEEKPEKWTIINDDAISISKTTVAFNVPHFCAVQAVEIEPTSEIALKTDTEIRYHRARKYECKAVFLGMPTKLTAGVSELLAECTSDSNFKLRIESHEQDGFINQKPSYTKEFDTYSGQQFQLKVIGKLTTVDKSEISIEFHPKRKDDNKRVIDIKPLNEQAVEHSHGQLQIRQLSDKTADKTADTEPLFEGTIDLHVKHPEASEKNRFNDRKDYLNDDLLKKLCNTLEPNKLQKLLVDLHVDVKDEDDFSLLKKWRDMSEGSIDCGVSTLMRGLCQLEENEAVEFMLRELKKWEKQYKDIKMSFTKWLSEIRPKNIKKHKEGNPPKPMSDDFLRSVAILMTKSGKENDIPDMFEKLGLEAKQISAITINKLYRVPKVQNYLLLKRFLEIHQQKAVESFEVLHKTFKENKEKFPGMDEECLSIAEKWLRSAENGDRTMQALSQYITIARQEDIEQEADETNTVPIVNTNIETTE